MSANNKEGPQYFPEHAENLQRHLLLPRAQVGLKEVDATVEPQESKIRPVIITSSSTPELIGFRSGPRSALLTVDGEAFKVEGCRVEEAFGKGKFYTTEHRATPVGGSSVGCAKKDRSYTKD